MKDINHKNIKKDDILAEIIGGCRRDRKWFDTIALWEYKGQTDGSGYRYNIENNPYSYWWVNPNKSFILDKNKLPEDFLFSFYHGMEYLDTPEEQNNNDIIDRVLNSNWKEKSINKIDVEDYEKRKINNQ